jgi:hypothetical protein
LVLLFCFKAGAIPVGQLVQNIAFPESLINGALTIWPGLFAGVAMVTIKASNAFIPYTGNSEIIRLFFHLGNSIKSLSSWGAWFVTVAASSSLL